MKKKIFISLIILVLINIILILIISLNTRNTDVSMKQAKKILNIPIAYIHENYLPNKKVEIIKTIDNIPYGYQTSYSYLLSETDSRLFLVIQGVQNNRDFPFSGYNYSIINEMVIDTQRNINREIYKHATKESYKLYYTFTLENAKYRFRFDKGTLENFDELIELSDTIMLDYLSFY